MAVSGSLFISFVLSFLGVSLFIFVVVFYCFLLLFFVCLFLFLFCFYFFICRGFLGGGCIRCGYLCLFVCILFTIVQMSLYLFLSNIARFLFVCFQ